MIRVIHLIKVLSLLLYIAFIQPFFALPSYANADGFKKKDSLMKYVAMCTESIVDYTTLHRTFCSCKADK